VVETDQSYEDSVVGSSGATSFLISCAVSLGISERLPPSN